MAIERDSAVGTLVKEAERRTWGQLQRDAARGDRSRRPSEHLIDAFENIVATIAGKGQQEDAVEVLLRLIRKEADELEEAVSIELKEAIGNGDRIDLLLEQAGRHQANADLWLSRLP